jgi:hypothetical protein
LSLAAVLLLTGFGFAAERGCPLQGSDEHKTVIGQYTIRTIRGEMEGCLEIRKNAAVVYQENIASTYVVGNNIEGAPGIPEIKPGTDITGSGSPEVIVGSWSGGAHCCFSFRVFQLGNDFRLLANLDAKDSGGAHFEDIDHDGKHEFVANDWTFAYWHASFAESPAPKVILRPGADKYGNFEYKLALELMRKPAPSQAELNTTINKIKSQPEWKEHVPPSLWAVMLDMIYTGNASLAWEVLDQSWPKEKPGKRGFLGAFCERLSDSEYFFELSDSLNPHPADCFLGNFGPD